MKRIIFACTHNAGRSQIAAAFFNYYSNNNLATSISAGTNPATKIHDNVILVMNEFGFDLSKNVPTFLSDELQNQSDMLITMGCSENCPVSNLKREDWFFDDPKDKYIEEVRIIRDQIEEKILDLIERNRWEKIYARE